MDNGKFDTLAPLARFALPAIMQESISTRLMRSVFICYCVVAIIVTLVHVVQEYRYTQEAIAKELQSYQLIFGPVLAKSMWDLDQERIQDILKAIHNVPIIEGIKIQKADQHNSFYTGLGKVIKSSGQALHLFEKQDSKDLAYSKDLFKYEFNIEYSYAGKLQTLGKATFYSSSHIVLNRVKLGFIFLVINAVIKGIALWLIFYWFSQKTLLTPLKKFILKVKNIDYENIDKLDPIKLNHNQDELQELETNFDKLIHELKTHHNDIKHFNKNLESKIEIRTEELNREKQKALDALKIKADFLATMSHEIRTPMNGLIGMITLIDDEHLDNKTKRNLGIARTSATSLLTLINDILDISKIEEGKLELEEHPFNLQSEIINTCQPFMAQAKKQGLTFTLNEGNLADTWVNADSIRLQQILNNLINNALKFTSQGSINIDCQLKNANDNYHMLEVKVSDTGIGISAENIHKLFQSFTQIDASTTRKFGGSGLGLAIIKDLCEKMKGRIWVESIQGKGSCFYFEVKLKKFINEQPTDKKADVHTRIQFEKNSVLLVEDNLINQMVAQDMLEGFNLKVDIAENGEAALKCMLERNDYQLIFMDCQMPILDGYDTTKAIRQGKAGNQYQSISIIAMTANAMKGDKEKCTAAGMDDYISKPVDIRLLETLLQHYLK